VKVKNQRETVHENFPTDFRKFRTTTESKEPPLGLRLKTTISPQIKRIKSDLRAKLI
jgi:hypothetical protein